MSVELIRKAACDRCGRECSHVEEKVLHEDVLEQYDVRTKVFKTIAFHYTEMKLQGYDNRFECGSDSFILCGNCVDELGEWLKRTPQNDEVRE